MYVSQSQSQIIGGIVGLSILAIICVKFCHRLQRPPSFEPAQPDFSQSSKDIQGPDTERRNQQSCPICLEENSNAILQQCGHFFHPACLATWTKTHPNCPYCRRKVCGEIRVLCIKCNRNIFKGPAAKIQEIAAKYRKLCSQCKI